MSTTLADARIALSQDIDDYWAGTTTSAGAAGGTTVVDTALAAKANDWITDETTDLITSGTYDEEERKVSSLDNSTGTLTVLAHGGQIGSAVTYELHRLFSASQKKRAILAATKDVFPYVFQEIFDESFVSGNWLKDGSFEHWTTSTDPTHWTDTTLTATETTTVGYYKHGLVSAKLTTAAGTLAQSVSNENILQFLRGKTVVFSAQGWCDTASCLRISVNDGATQTYSSYHAGDSAWTKENPRNDNFYVEQAIAKNATEVTFTVHHEKAAGTSYVDDARAISGRHSPIYIGYLWLAQNKPSQVFIESTNYGQEEPWVRVRDYKVDTNGYLYIPTDYPVDRRVRIRGTGYLEFLSSGDASEDWSATVTLDEPQLQVLTAQAAAWLYGRVSMPNYETGARESFQEARSYWEREVMRRAGKYGMSTPSATVHYGVR